MVRVIDAQFVDFADDVDRQVKTAPVLWIRERTVLALFLDVPRHVLGQRELATDVSQV